MAEIIVQLPSREFVDIDQMFTRHPETGNVMLKKKQNAVKQSVLNLLQLRKWDKPFHPEISSPIYDYLFELSTPAIRMILESEVEKYISANEPRYVVTNVTVSFPDAHTIKCELEGTLVNTTEPFTIVYFVNRIR